MFKKFPVIFISRALLMFLLLVIAGGCSAESLSESSEDNGSSAVSPATSLAVLKANLLTPPSTLDPAKFVSESELFLIEHIYNTLFKIENGEIIPELAENWSFSEEGNLIINLKENVKFHNGEFLEAEDVEFSINRVMQEETASPYSFALSEALDMNSERVAEAINIIDPSTIEIELSSHNYTVAEVLAHPAFSILNKDVVEQSGNHFSPGTYFSANANVVGTGPFELIEWIDNMLITLQPNKNYFKEREVDIERVELSIYKNQNTAVRDFGAQELDIIWLDPASVEKYRKNDSFLNERIDAGTPGTVYLLSFRNKSAPFDDLRVRQAFASVIDRGGIANTIDNTVPLVGLFPGEDLNNRLSQLGRDELTLLNEAGYEDGFPEVTLAYTKDEISNRLAGILKDRFSQLGVKMQLKQSEAEFHKLENIEADLYIKKISLPASGTSNALTYFPHGENSFFPYIDNDEFGEFFEQAAGKAEISEREKIYRQAEQGITDKSLVHGLVQVKNYYGIQNNVNHAIDGHTGRISLTNVKIGNNFE